MTRHDLWQLQPAVGLGERWRDATPLGNGKTGLSLLGGCRRDLYIINRHDLWHGSHEGDLPDVAYCIPKMRELMEAGHYEDACNYMYDELCKAGYSTNAGNIRPLAQVEFFFDCTGVYNHYRRILHMDSGEAEITYQLDKTPYRRRAFVSRRRDLVVTRMQAAQSGDMAIAPGFYGSSEGNMSDWMRQRDGENTRYSVENDCLIYSTRHEDGTWFGLVVRAVSNGRVRLQLEKAVKTDGKGTPDGPHIVVEGATDTTVVMAPFTGAKSRAVGERQALRRVQAAGADYDKLFAEHRRLHHRLYAAADVCLYQGRTFHANEELLQEARESRCSVELAEKLWRFGRYLFISGTGPDSNPFPLYGLWGAGYFLPWNQNVANENVEAIYWHAAVGGLASLVPSIIHYYYNQMPVAREVAKRLYNCRGIFIGTYSAPGASGPSPAVPAILHFNGVAGWLSRHFYEYYQLTRDEVLLEQKILPFMLEAAAFYEDYVTEENGTLVISPSVSPENSPLEFIHTKRPTATGHYMPVTKNATIEMAILKELLTNLLALSKDHSLPPERVARWQDMLKKVPPYRINGDGAIAEWMDPKMTDNYFHRHLSHVYPLFPGTELEDTGRQDLIPYFRRAVELRKLGSMTGWSMAHMAAIYARLGDGDKAYDTLSMMTKVCLLPNFFTLHNDYRGMGITTENMGDLHFAPVQLDAIVGSVNAVQEMLLRVAPSRVCVLPACPTEWKSGSTKLHIFGGNVTLRWDLDKKYCRATFYAERDLSLTVVMPFGAGEHTLCLSAGEMSVLTV